MEGVEKGYSPGGGEQIVLFSKIYPSLNNFVCQCSLNDNASCQYEKNPDPKERRKTTIFRLIPSLHALGNLYCISLDFENIFRTGDASSSHYVALNMV